MKTLIKFSKFSKELSEMIDKVIENYNNNSNNFIIVNNEDNINEEKCKKIFKNDKVFPIIVLLDSNNEIIKTHNGNISEEELKDFILYDNYYLTLKEINVYPYRISAKSLKEAAWKAYEDDVKTDERLPEYNLFQVYNEDDEPINDAGELM